MTKSRDLRLFFLHTSFWLRRYTDVQRAWFPASWPVCARVKVLLMCLPTWMSMLSGLVSVTSTRHCLYSFCRPLSQFVAFLAMDSTLSNYTVVPRFDKPSCTYSLQSDGYGGTFEDPYLRIDLQSKSHRKERSSSPHRSGGTDSKQNRPRDLYSIITGSFVGCFYSLCSSRYGSLSKIRA